MLSFAAAVVYLFLLSASAWHLPGSPDALLILSIAISSTITSATPTGDACTSWSDCDSVCCSDGVGQACTSTSGTCCENNGAGVATDCNTVSADACGVQGGDNSTCADACGVPNSDSSSCADACGVANGDSSTCADACGIANGDSSTCAFPGDGTLLTTRYRLDVTASSSSYWCIEQMTFLAYDGNVSGLQATASSETEFSGSYVAANALTEASDFCSSSNPTWLEFEFESPGFRAYSVELSYGQWGNSYGPVTGSFEAYDSDTGNWTELASFSDVSTSNNLEMSFSFTACAENEYVAGNNTCMTCPVNTSNTAGDDFTGNETFCHDWVVCANQGETCECDGLARYGADSSWLEMDAFGSIQCDTSSPAGFGSDPAVGTSKTCECDMFGVCPVGTYEDGDSCLNEPADASCPGATNISGCVCNAGFIGDGTSTCTACGMGTYDDSDLCVTEPSNGACPGSTDVTGCTCDAGFTGDGTATCTACDVGTYDDSDLCFSEPSNGACPGSTNVTGCTCDAGFTGDGTATCTACAAGEYEESDACLTEPQDGACPGGTGVSGCTCNVGFVGDGTATCEACAVGEYEESDACLTEPENGACPGGTDVSGCTCNVGFVGDGTATCVGILCEENEYVLAHVCTDCPGNMTNNAGDYAPDLNTVCQGDLVDTVLVNIILSGLDNFTAATEEALVAAISESFAGEGLTVFVRLSNDTATFNADSTSNTVRFEIEVQANSEDETAVADASVFVNSANFTEAVQYELEESDHDIVVEGAAIFVQSAVSDKNNAAVIIIIILILILVILGIIGAFNRGDKETQDQPKKNEPDEEGVPLANNPNQA